MRYLVGRYGISTRRACRVVPTTRSSAFYRSCKDPLAALRQRMRELAQPRVRFGYRRLRVLLQREGWPVGKERLYQVYTEEGLALRRKRPWPGIAPSVGGRGDAYDDAVAESVIGLYKTEVIGRRDRWQTLEVVEFAPLRWVHWFSHRRLLGPIGFVPPAEHEASYHQQVSVA